MTTGDVPDICYVDNGDFLLLPQAAWNDKIVDVSRRRGHAEERIQRRPR